MNDRMNLSVEINIDGMPDDIDRVMASLRRDPTPKGQIKEEMLAAIEETLPEFKDVVLKAISEPEL